MANTYKASKKKDLQKIIDDKKSEVNIPTLPGTSSPDVVSVLRSTFLSLESYFNQFVFPDYIAAYEDKYLYAGRRQSYLNSMGWTDKSNIKFPLVDSVHETYFSNTYDLDPTIKIIPESDIDIDITDRMRAYTEWAYHRSRASEVLPDVDRVAVLIGVGYSKCNFLDYESTRVILKKDKESGKSVEVNKTMNIKKPLLDYVDEFSVYFNPGGSDFYTVPKFIRDVASIHDVKQKYSTYIDSSVNWEDILSKPSFFSNKDYKRIKLLSTRQYYQQNKKMFGSLDATGAKDMKSNTDSSFLDENIFVVDYKKNELVEVIEYYEDNRFCLIVNGYLLFDGPSPYPFEGDPIVRTVFRNMSGTLFPRGIWHTLKNYQHNVDIFLNNWIDTINGLANPSYIAEKGVFGVNTPQFMKNTPRKVYERQSNKSIDILRLVDPSALASLQQGLQWFVQQAYEAIGLNSYTQGGQGKVERTAGGVQSRTQVLKTALVPFFKNKNHTLTEIMKRFIAMGSIIMPDTFPIYDNKGIFHTMKLEDLENDFLWFYDSKALSSIHKLETRQDILTGLQYAKNPQTIAVLENKLLDTFDMEKLTIEEKKELIKEEFELLKYRSTLEQSLPPQPGQENAPMPTQGQQQQEMPIEATNMIPQSTVQEQPIAADTGGREIEYV